MFLEKYMEAVDDFGFTSKVHGLQHVVDDCEHYGCHIEALSAYVYESFQNRWDMLIRSGNLVMQQVRLVIISSIHIQIRFHFFLTLLYLLYDLLFTQ